MHVLTKKFVACVPVRFSSLPLSFTLLAASIYFLTAGTKFSCCSSSEIRPLCFLSLALALCRSFFFGCALQACRLISSLSFSFCPNLWTWQ